MVFVVYAVFLNDRNTNTNYAFSGVQGQGPVPLRHCACQRKRVCEVCERKRLCSLLGNAVQLVRLRPACGRGWGWCGSRTTAPPRPPRYGSLLLPALRWPAPPPTLSPSIVRPECAQCDPSSATHGEVAAGRTEAREHRFGPSQNLCELIPVPLQGLRNR